MWTLKYQYELEDGSVHCVSCCLRRNETYSIGRSSKNLLNVKNDKSISRQHVSLSWDGNERQLVLVNQGKMTMTGGKYMKIGESVNFNASQGGVINVELGTKPLTVELQWVKFFWDIPPSCSEFALSLEELGVEVLLGVADERSNLMILDPTLDYDEDRCLYGLIKGVPLMNQKLLTEFCAAVSGSETDFETLWSKMMVNHDLHALPEHVSGKGELIFEGLEFFLLCPTIATVNKYMEKAIEAAGGKISRADNMQELQNVIQLRQSTSNIVVLNTSFIKVDLASPVHKTYSVKDVIEAVLHGDISKLMNGVSKSRDSSKRTVEPTTTETIEKPNIENSSTKRRRLNRPKVKPLDSLSFFAGGETLREQPTPVEVAAGLTSRNIPEETSKKGEIDTSKVVYANNTDEVASKSLGNLESVPSKLSKSQTLLNKVLSNQSTEGHSEDALIPTTVPVEPNKLMKTPRNRALGQENESRVVPATGSQSKAQIKRTPTLSNYNSSEPRKKSSSSDDMIQVIQDAKNREVKRLSSTIVQVDQEELTDQAIQKLGDLALVDQNDSLLRQKNGEPTSDSHESHPEWNHRKNFKKFVKIWPQYRRQEDQTAREGSSDTIRNRAFLLTRQYVPMRKYIPGSDRQLHEDLYDFPEHNTVTHESRGQRFDGEEQFSFSRPSKENGGDNSNKLFVVDEDDESQNEVIPEAPVPRSSATTSETVRIQHRPEAAIQEEDSDDEPTFTFKRKKR